MKNLLFNPFERFAGGTSLAIGLATLVITALAACAGNIHLDGVLDLHAGSTATLSTSLAEGGISWLCMVLFIYIAGLLFSKSSIRLIDVLGTQAMARFPMLIATLFSWLLYSDKILKFIEYKALHKGEPVEIGLTDGVAFALMTLLIIASTIWMISLMYKAYSVACNVKGSKGVISFIAALLLAEAVSKLLLSFL